MLMFILNVSCLTMCNLPWFMYLRFQAPMQHCSFIIRLYFHHQTHPQLSIVSALAQPHYSLWSYLIFPSSILDTYWPGGLSSSVISFLLFMLFVGFLRQKYWSGLPFPSPVDHVLPYSSLLCMWSFWLAFCDYVFVLEAVGLYFLLLLSVIWWVRIRGFFKFLDVRDWLWGKLDLALVGRAMLNKSLMQFSADRGACTPSLLVGWPEATQYWSLQALW